MPRKQTPLQKWASQRNWAKHQLLGIRTNLYRIGTSVGLSTPEQLEVQQARLHIDTVLRSWETGQHVSRLEFLEKLDYLA